MRTYEVMVILDPELEDRTVQPSLETFLNVVRADGGSVDKLEVWGRRRLAYPINKKNDGYYIFYNVIAPGGALDEMERSFRIADEVIRHKLFRLPDSEAKSRGMTEAA